MPVELKPCPFCGGTDIRTTWCEANGKVWWDIQCRRCGIETDRGERTEDAIKEFWNQRAQGEAVATGAQQRHAKTLRNCITCKYSEYACANPACRDCEHFDNWEPKGIRKASA